LELFKFVSPKRVRIRGDWSEEKSNPFPSYLMQKLFFFPLSNQRNQEKKTNTMKRSTADVPIPHKQPISVFQFGPNNCNNLTRNQDHETSLLPIEEKNNPNAYQLKCNNVRYQQLR
jgi:hypothetical protein